MVFGSDENQNKLPRIFTTLNILKLMNYQFISMTERKSERSRRLYSRFELMAF